MKTILKKPKRLKYELRGNGVIHIRAEDLFENEDVKRQLKDLENIEVSEKNRHNIGIM